MMSPEPALTTSTLMPVSFSNFGTSASTIDGLVGCVDDDGLVLRDGGNAHGGKEDACSQSSF